MRFDEKVAMLTAQAPQGAVALAIPLPPLLGF